MQNWQPTNPVERRLMTAHEDWLRFAKNPRARLLYWRTDEADIELVRAYFQSQEELSSAVLRLTSPFESAEQYSRALAKELIDFYDARREGSAARGVTADWAPAWRGAETSTQYLLKLTDSLMTHHPDVFPGMVLILAPGTVSKDQDFERWLDRLLAEVNQGAWRSDRLRFVQYGTAADPLAWLRTQWPDRVRVVHGRYQMRAVPRELVAQSGERGPSGQFRRLFAELSETLAHDDPKRLEILRRAALEVTTKQQWFDQGAIVHLLAGAAYLKWQSHNLALDAYQQATHSGQQALEIDHVAGSKLVVNGLFGQASVHLMRGDYAEAARCYGEASFYTEAERDGILTVEARRMQGWCLDKAGRYEQALDAGFKALDGGEWIEPALRANSNLQLVTKWMLDQTGFLGAHGRRPELIQRLKQLYGDNWSEAIKPLAAEDVSRQIAAGDNADVHAGTSEENT
ncbi:tol-pal system YbgF family protein [Paraburkholderia sabiae]|uniref:Tetratricopeptide repeat protein n=1 Tax=Paraburkholderia sabiae TaxID=273251 RepID=A0ABU9QMJ3_9BURK|nr:hypothetical protein [Paraburkholderia sabiae]WJZ79109.1 hypothetical protein QEN71_34610 [Paraburkholderia sabiae]CAD6514286.1 hypothetical protein LMG24235_00881 [Paraburkholderia sabiae]